MRLEKIQEYFKKKEEVYEGKLGLHITDVSEDKENNCFEIKGYVDYKHEANEYEEYISFSQYIYEKNRADVEKMDIMGFIADDLDTTYEVDDYELEDYEVNNLITQGLEHYTYRDSPDEYVESDLQCEITFVGWIRFM